MNKDTERIYESHINIHGILLEQMVPQGMCYIEDPETGGVQELARGELMDYHSSAYLVLVRVGFYIELSYLLSLLSSYPLNPVSIDPSPHHEQRSLLGH